MRLGAYDPIRAEVFGRLDKIEVALIALFAWMEAQADAPPDAIPQVREQARDAIQRLEGWL